MSKRWRGLCFSTPELWGSLRLAAPQEDSFEGQRQWWLKSKRWLLGLSWIAGLSGAAVSHSGEEGHQRSLQTCGAPSGLPAVQPLSCYY